MTDEGIHKITDSRGKTVYYTVDGTGRPWRTLRAARSAKRRLAKIRLAEAKKGNQC